MQTSECEATGKAIAVTSLSFSSVELVHSVFNEDLDQLGETKFSFAALFLAWK